MTLEELILFHLDSMGGRLHATIKHVSQDIREKGEYLDNDLELAMDIMSTFRSLEQRKIIKQVLYQEMNDNQKFISDTEGEEFYVKL